MLPGLWNLLFLVTPFNTPPALWRYFTEVDRRPRAYAWLGMMLFVLGVGFQILFSVLNAPERSNASVDGFFTIGLLLLLAGGVLLAILRHLVAQRLHRYLGEREGDFCVWCGGVSTAEPDRSICSECATIIPPQRKPLMFMPNAFDLIMGIRWQSISPGAWKYLLKLNRISACCFWLGRALFIVAAISMLIDLLSGPSGLSAQPGIIVIAVFSASILAGLCLAFAGREWGVYSLRRFLAHHQNLICCQCAVPIKAEPNECAHCGYALQAGESGLHWMILFVNDSNDGLRPSGIY